MIDAGISLRRIRDGLHRFGLSPDDLTCVLITHDHSDHIGGINMLVKYHKTPVFSSIGAGYGLCGAIPLVEPFLSCFETGTELEFGDISVGSFITPHDATESVGYTLRAGGKKLVYATDLGYVTDKVLSSAIGSDIAIIEANHDREMLKNGPYPDFLKKRILSKYGHLANCDSGNFAAALAVSGTRYIQLAHLSRENNTPELAYETVANALAESRVVVGKDVELTVAPLLMPAKVYEV